MSKGFKFDATAVKRDDCAACKEDVPIFTNEKGERMHLDLFTLPKFGAMYDCPCTYGEEPSATPNPNQVGQ